MATSTHTSGVRAGERRHLLRLVRPGRPRPDQAAGRGVTAMTEAERAALAKKLAEVNRRSENRPR
jgi:hypothetical protein